MGRTNLWMLACFTPLLLGPVGCGEGGAEAGREDPEAVSEEARRGGTVVVAERTGITTLNPLVSTDFIPAQIQRHLLYTPLLRLDTALAVRPYLAESWELNEDSTQVRFRLQEGARWHDGTPVTARDVAFTFQRVRDPRVPYPNRSWFDLWEGVETVGESEVSLVLQRHAGFLFAWTQLPILPAHLLADVEVERLPTHPLGPDGPVGSGPFSLAGREGTDRWLFEANPDFPEALGGRPYLDRLVYRQIPDETSLIAELRAGRVHFVMELPPGAVSRMEAEPEVDVVRYPTRAYAFVAWNTLRPPFGEAEVRRALTMAIDREGLLRAVREDLGQVASGPVGPWHWAHDPEWRPLPYAPDSARAILERAGWRQGTGGVLEKDGRSFRFDLLTTDSRVRQDIAIIVQSQLARIGVDARVRTMEPAAVGAAVTSPERRFDAVILAFEQDHQLDDRGQWVCDRRGQPFHFSSYCDPELDEVLEAIPSTLDREARGELYRRYHEIVARDQPYTFLWFETSAAGVRRELQGVRLDSRGPLASLERWWLHPSGRGDERR